MLTRTYQLDTNSLSANLSALVPNSPEVPEPELLMQYLKANGVDVTPPMSLWYKPRTGLLLVHTTEQQHKKLQELLAKLKAGR